MGCKLTMLEDVSNLNLSKELAFYDNNKDKYKENDIFFYNRGKIKLHSLLYKDAEESIK
jgi:hypothetical protein